MKNILLFASVAAIVGGMTAIGQEKSAAPTLAPVSFPAQQSSYSPNDIKILGTLNSGQTSKLVEYSRTPKYRAFVFEGNGHDQVEVTVTGGNRNAYRSVGRFDAYSDCERHRAAVGNAALSRAGHGSVLYLIKGQLKTARTIGGSSSRKPPVRRSHPTLRANGLGLVFARKHSRKQRCKARVFAKVV